MILLLGASGYFGRTFAGELRRRELPFIPLSRQAVDYTRFDLLFDYMRRMKPEFVINAAGFYCRPEEDGLEAAREQSMLANSLLPQMIARVCLMTRTPWGHLSTGSIYTGAKVIEEGKPRVERDLSRPEAREIFEKRPHQIRGFTEQDEPNFSFRFEPSTFYSGTKALAEEAIRDIGQSYIWRPRLAFSDRLSPHDFLWQFQRDTKRWDTIDSMSNTEDCVRACLDLWEMKAPYGIYNVTNPGAIGTRSLAGLMQNVLKLPQELEFLGDVENTSPGSRVPQSHCILDVGKLLATGVKMRPLEQALEDSLHREPGLGRAERKSGGSSAARP